MIVWRPDNLIEFFFIASLVSSVLLFTETENFPGHKYKKKYFKNSLAIGIYSQQKMFHKY